MATPSSARLKRTRKANMAPQTAGVTELTSAVADAEASSDCGNPTIEHEELSRLAYSYWEARGFSGGSAEEDWYRAVEELKRQATNNPRRQTAETAA